MRAGPVSAGYSDAVEGYGNDPAGHGGPTLRAACVARRTPPRIVAVNCDRVVLRSALVVLLVLASLPALCQSPPTPPDLVIPPVTPRAHAYHLILYTLYFAGTAWGWAGLWWFVRSGWSRRWRELAERRFRAPFLRVVLYYAVFSLAVLVWALPLSGAYALIEARYGFSTRTFGGWLADQARGYAVGLVFAPVVAAGYWLLRVSPKRWWLWLWAASAPWILGTPILQPVLVAPLYNDFRPMPPGPLRDRIEALARRAGIGDATILVVDSSKRTRKQNAYVTGLGPTHRIVLWDNLVRSSPPDQVEAVVAHEIGHYVLGHRWRGLLWGVLGAGVILWLLSRVLPVLIERMQARCGLEGLGDLAALPLVALVLSVMLFLQSPAEAAISRCYEREADRYELRLTGNGKAAARQFIRFVRQDYADPDPPAIALFWFYTHPPIRERVATALGQR